MTRGWPQTMPARRSDGEARRHSCLAQARTILDEALQTRRELHSLMKALRRLQGPGRRWRWLLGRDRVRAAETERLDLVEAIDATTASLAEQLAAIDYLLGETTVTVERSRLLDGQPFSVSLLVTNWNGAASLDVLLRSHRDHHGARAAELVIVDHGSTDHSRDLVRRWMDELPIVLLCCDRNQRYATANNLARSHAQGKTLVLANNDVAFDTPVLPAMVEALENNAVGLVGVPLYYPDADGKRTTALQHAGISFRPDARNGFMRPINLQSLPDDSAGPQPVAAVTGALAACRSDDFDRVGGLLETFDYGYEDVDLALSFRRQLGLTSVVLPDIGALHREFGSQSRQAEQALRNRRARNIAIFRSLHQDYLQRAVLHSTLTQGAWHAEPLRVRLPEFPGEAGERPELLAGSETAPFRLQAISDHQQRIRQGFCGIWLLFTPRALENFQAPRGALVVGLVAPGGAGKWLAETELGRLDLLVCEQAEDTEQLTAESFIAAVSADSLPRPTDPEWLRWLLEALEAERARWTVAITVATDWDEDSGRTAVKRLGLALRKAGYSVRLESPTTGTDLRLFRQDLLIALGDGTATIEGPGGYRRTLSSTEPAAVLDALAPACPDTG